MWVLDVDYRLLVELFLRFLKIGLVGFGGGWAILPIIEREVVEEAKWISHSEYLDLVAIAGSTPGPVAVNAATYVGFKLAGVVGAVVATIAVILPPFTIISLIVYTLTTVISNRLIQAVLNGLKAAVIGLITLALISTIKEVSVYITRYSQVIAVTGIVVLVIVMVYYFKIHPIIAIIVSAVIGLLLGILNVW